MQRLTAMKIEKKKTTATHYICSIVDQLTCYVLLPICQPKWKQNTRWSYRRLYGWKNTHTNRLTSSLMSLLTLKNNCSEGKKTPNERKTPRNNAHLIFSLIFAFIGPANGFFRSHRKYIKIYIIEMLLFGIWTCVQYCCIFILLEWLLLKWNLHLSQV